MNSNGLSKLYFFAIWCGECSKKLTKLDPKQYVLIASFEEEDRVNKTLKKLNITAPCFLDSGELTAAYSVKSIPSEREFKRPSD